MPETGRGIDGDGAVSAVRSPVRVRINRELCKDCGICVALCPHGVLAAYARVSGQNDPAIPSEMLLRQHERAVPAERFEGLGPRMQERYPVGVLHHVDWTEYLSAYQEVIRCAQGG